MATRKGNGKVTETVKRLLALEVRVGAVETAVAAVEVRVGAVEYEVHELRGDLNAGVDKLLAGLASLEKAIDRVADIRPRLDALEQRVARLEGHA